MSGYREPLFSVHATGDGQFALYLEERDANLDLLEDVVEQVNLIDLAGLKEFSSVDALKDPDAVARLDIVRADMPEVIAKIGKMTEAEALTLAEQLIMSVKEYRAKSRQPIKLELVK